MSSSENKEIETIINKIKDGISLSISDKLDGEKTIMLLKTLENTYINYGYKSKYCCDVYYEIEKISEGNSFNDYIRYLLRKDSLYELGIFSKNIIKSDLMFYNQEFFNLLVKNEILCSMCYKESSFKLVKKILSEKNLFYKIKKCEDFKNKDKILRECILNNDDRIFKLVVNNLNETNIKEYLNLLVRVDKKYFLKRIKLVNKNIDLKKYSKELIELNYHNFDSLKNIIRFYQQDNVLYDYRKLNLTLAVIDSYDNSSLIFRKNYYELKDLCIPKLFSAIQKNLLLHKLYVPFKKNLDILIDIIETNTNIKTILLKDLNNILKYLVNKPIKDSGIIFRLANLLNDKYRNEIIKQCENNPYLNIFMILYGNYYPLFLSYGFYTNEFSNDLLKINKLKSMLRIKLKKISKINSESYVNRSRRLFDEIVNFKPKEIPVLSNGSRNYQIIHQSYHSIKPPVMFNISKKYLCPLLTLKIDGINVTRLPSSIKYKIPYLVKAEYLEQNDQERFYVYDVNLPDMTYVERVMFLRKNHPCNLPELYEASNIKELLNILKDESKFEMQWFNENKNELSVWYPKAFIKYKGELSELGERVLNNEFNPPYLNYPIDGLILHSGGEDCKIKPKKLHTIDILYKNNKWYSTNNTEVPFIIINPYEIELENNKIYRCFPVEDNTYYVKDERIDKVLPNSLKIIENIRESYSQNSYYQKSSGLKCDEKKEIKRARTNELVFLRSLGLSNNYGILDLCSGKGNILRVLPNYFYYTLIDKNPLEISNIDNVRTIKCDINKMDLKKYRDDIWICINGLWYIYDNFISNVIKYKPKFLVFNTHSKDIGWKNGDSYLKKEGNKVKYYYRWCHKVECEEDYLSIEKVNRDLEEQGYKMIKYYKDDNSLSSNFEFYYYVLGE